MAEEILDSAAIDTEVVDTPDIDTSTDVDTDVDTDTSTDETTDTNEGDETTDTDAAPAPGVKATPAEMRKFINEFKKVNPRAAEAVARAYFKLQGLEKSFPTSAIATSYKNAVDEIGGVEAVTALRETSSNYAEQLNRFNTGDSAVISEWAKAAPESFATLAPTVLTELYNANKEAYFDTLSPIFSNSLNQGGIPQAITDITDSLQRTYETIKSAGGNTAELERAWTHLQKMSGWVKGIQDGAANVGNKAVNPESSKLTAEREAFNKEKQTEFDSSLASSAQSKFAGAIGKDLAPFLKTRKLDGPARQLLQRNIQSQIERGMLADKNFQRQAQSLLKTKDKGRLVSLVNAKIDELSPNATRAIWKQLYGAGKAVAKKGVADTSSVTNGARPRREDVDQNWVASHQTDYISGRAKLKNGKMVQWNPNA